MNSNDSDLQGGQGNSLVAGGRQAIQGVNSDGQPGRQSEVSASSFPLTGPGRHFGIQGVNNRSEQGVNSEPGRQSGRQQQRGWAGRLSGGRLLLRPRAHRASRRGGRLLRGTAGQQLPDWFSLSGR